MIKKIYTDHNLYGKYFLATEAPGDEVVTDETKVKRNVKVIAVKPDNRKRTDFSAAGDEQINPETTEVNTDDLDTGGDDDFTGEETPDTPENTTDIETQTEPETDTEDTGEPATTEEPTNTADTETDEPDTGDETDMTGDAEATGEDGTENATGEEQTTDDGDGTDELDTGGEEDFTGDNEETGDETADDTATDDGTTEDGKPGVEFDSTRKYNLFKEYMSLYNACENYISKLENILKDDTMENQLIRICVNNLREIKDILYDYMTIRYSINSYVQSLLFYQKMVVAVQLVFELLREVFNKNDKPKK